jgi:hypothetical protein
MTELYLGDWTRTLYHYYLVAPLVSALPSSLTLGDDPFIYDMLNLGLQLSATYLSLSLCAMIHTVQ